MNCQEALELLYDYVDREASESTNEKIKDHLKNCHDCFSKYRLEESVASLLNERAEGLKKTPSLDSLKSNIMANLDAIDNGSTDSGAKPFFKLSTVMAAVASLVIMVGASFVVSNYYSHHDNYIPLEKAHWAVAQNPINFQNDEQVSTLILQLSKDLQYSLNESVSGLQLTGAQMEQIDDVAMAHFVYGTGDAAVSVFVADSKSFSIPSELDGTTAAELGHTMFDHNCRGCRIVFHKIGNAIIITASSDRTVDLLSFIPGSKSI